MTQRGPIELMLLLYSDPEDPVCRVIRGHGQRFNCALAALSLRELVNEVAIGPHWHWGGRTIDPARTAVINRLASLDALATEGGRTSFFSKQQIWNWLHGELQRFAYASSLPSAHSIDGGFGSLLDQWQDLPGLFSALRVPVHRTSWNEVALHGDVHVVDPWSLYSLGQRVPATSVPAGRLLAYVRPEGWMVQMAQVGGMVMFANAPPQMTPMQRDCMLAYSQAMAAASTSRILEHAFFVGRELPVFYSTCPAPVLTGTLAEYADLVVEGLLDDIKRHRERAAA